MVESSGTIVSGHAAAYTACASGIASLTFHSATGVGLNAFGTDRAAHEHDALDERNDVGMQANEVADVLQRPDRDQRDLRRDSCG